MRSRHAFFLGLLMTTSAAALAPDLALQYARALGQASGIDGAAALESGGEVLVAVQRSLPDVDANKKRRQTLRYRLDKNGSLRRAGQLSDDPESIVGRCRAPSGKLAVFSKTDAGAVVDVYEEDVLVQRVALDAKEVGKLLVGDVMVGGASWSADEATLAFVADAPAPEQKHAFGGEFRFREELGEKYVGVSSPRVYLLDLLEDTVEALEPPPDCVYEGQPAFSPTKPRQLATVAWTTEYRKLGLIYCFNRPSAIYLRDLDEALAERLSSDAVQRSPRWKPDGTKLAFLAAAEPFDTHDGAVELKVWDAASGNIAVVVEAPAAPDYRSECPGLWSCARLLEDCWSGDTLILNSLWGSAPSVLLVDTTVEAERTSDFSVTRRLSTAAPPRGGLSPVASAQDKMITRVGDADNAHAALCVARGIAIVHTTAPDVAAGALLTVDVKSGDILASIAAPPLGVVSSKLATFDAAPRPLECDVIAVDAFEALLLREEGSEKRPLIVSVHGGPHSCTPTSYSAALAFLAARGFAILSVNYRGSTGFGKEMLDSLPDKIGSQDVDDVLRAIEVCCAAHDVIDRERIAVVGGSHGGFLGAHLVARAPQLFKAAALRNPVTNLGAMVGSSDIPDWVACEGAVAGTPPTPDALAKLFSMSPIAGIDAVEAPVLLAIGLKDRRVPPAQGIEYYHALRARGKAARLLTYPDDDHALDTPRTSADHWVEIAAFLEERLMG